MHSVCHVTDHWSTKPFIASTLYTYLYVNPIFVFLLLWRVQEATIMNYGF